MINKLTCTECPSGCVLSVTVENGKVINVEGQKCPKGEKHAVDETENPVRILTSAILTEGMSIKMIPVRTDNPIPKADLFRAMDEIKKVRVDKPVRVGDIVVKDLLGLGVNLVATRSTVIPPEIRERS